MERIERSSTRVIYHHHETLWWAESTCLLSSINLRGKKYRKKFGEKSNNKSIIKMKSNCEFKIWQISLEDLDRRQDSIDSLRELYSKEAQEMSLQRKHSFQKKTRIQERTNRISWINFEGNFQGNISLPTYVKSKYIKQQAVVAV